MIRLLRQIINDQMGQVLPLVLILVAVGGLFIVPVLNHTSSGLLASQTHTANMIEIHCADSGLENAFWRLLNEPSFVQTMTEHQPTAEYSLNINSKDTSIAVTRIAGMGGDTLTMDVDYLIPIGHQLEMRIVVFEDDCMHFAYDTEVYNAWLRMPVASGNPTYYLHNNPTPPTGDTNAQADLLMDESDPPGTTFYNYDQNYDSNPGRKIDESDGGPDGLELKEYQNWLTDPYTEATYFYGTAVLNLFIAPDGFNFDNEGEFRVYLRDYDPVGDTYTEISSTDYLIEEEQWAQMWQPTAPEGKYKIVATCGDTQLESLVALGFGYIRVIHFIHSGSG